MVSETLCVGPHSHGSSLQVYLTSQSKRIPWTFSSRMRHSMAQEHGTADASGAFCCTAAEGCGGVWDGESSAEAV